MLFSLLSLTILAHTLDFAGNAEKEIASPDVYVNLGQMQKFDANIIKQKKLPSTHRNLESFGYRKPYFYKRRMSLHQKSLRPLFKEPLSLNKRELKREDLMLNLADPKCFHEFKLKQKDNQLLLRDLMSHLKREKIDFKREYPILTILEDKYKEEPKYKLTKEDNMQLNKMFMKLDLCTKLRTDNLELFKLLEPRCRMLLKLNRRDLTGYNIGSPILAFRINELDNGSQSATFIKGNRM